MEHTTKPAGTTFQQAVWSASETIAHGKTVSYQQLAQKIDKPKAVRAVGTALGKNPMPIIIPCHRIVQQTGAIGHYTGGSWRKHWLLEHEKRG